MTSGGIKAENKLVVYTCIAGDYDDLLSPVTEPGVDYICFTDRNFRSCGEWTLMPLPVAETAQDNFLISRYVKMHPHILFPNHQYSVYVDGNIKIKAPLTNLVSTAMGKGVIAMYRHFSRGCLYDEAKELALLGYDWILPIDRQVTTYRMAGFPKGVGLVEASVIVRNNHDAGTIQLMEAWWKELLEGVRRDQVSICFLSWRMGTPIVDLGESDPRFVQRLFELKVMHKRRYPLMHLIRSATNKLLLLIWKPKTL